MDDDLLHHEHDHSYEAFLKINKELLNELRDTEAYRPLNDLYSYFEKQEHNWTNLCRYAEAQLNLSKNLDFLLLATKINLSQGIIQKIVSASVGIVRTYYRKVCGNHEDAACVVGGISYINRLSQQQDPTEDDAICFSGEIKEETINRSTTIYRIVSDQKFARGRWWLKNKPSNPRDWRSEYAVLKSWNQGGWCVEVTLNQGVKVWVGKAAIQVVPMSPDRCYLMGGGEQLLITDLASISANLKIDPWPC
jgi:hypothetical protein